MGCASMARMHHERLERIHRTHDEVIEISKKLEDIEQMMLYIGRIRVGALANAALDVAIFINGEPDDDEKKYAESITIEAIQSLKIHAAKLMKRQEKLRAIFREDERKAIDESYAIHAMESRHQFIEKIFTNCLVATCIVGTIFFLKRFF
jgi:predicted nucleotidyltransferase